MPGTQTDRQELISHLLGEPLEQWVANRRGCSFRALSHELHGLIGPAAPTKSALHKWFGQKGER